MKIRSTIQRLLNSLRKNHAADLDAELQSHLQLDIDDNLRPGISHKEARRQALLKLGGVQQTKLLIRDQQTLPIVESFLRDLRHAAHRHRQPHRLPGAFPRSRGFARGCRSCAGLRPGLVQFPFRRESSRPAHHSWRSLFPGDGRFCRRLFPVAPGHVH